MNEVMYICASIGLSAAAVGVSSVYEYYKCRQIFLDEPGCSFDEIVQYHDPIERVILLMGVPGYEIAESRYSSKDDG